MKVEIEKFTNPQGLNQVLRELLGYSVEGDWDRDVPKTLCWANKERRGAKGSEGSYLSTVGRHFA